MILGRSFLATVHTRVKVYQGELSLGTEDDRVVFDICGNVKHRTNPSEEVFMVNGAQADVLDCIERLQAPKVDHKRKGEALSPESAKIRKHICKPVWDYGNKDIKVWPTCDPNLRKCNGGDTIYGIGKDGTLMEWECFVDDKRGSIEGLVKGELFKEDKQKSSDSNERLRNSPAHYERFNGKFENDVKVIADEYALKMGKKEQLLDAIWDSYERVYSKPDKPWLEFTLTKLEVGYQPKLKVETYEVKREDVNPYHQTPFRTSPQNTPFPFQIDILMFQQHHDESFYQAWSRFKDLIQKDPHFSLDLWSKIQIFYNHVDHVTQMALDVAARKRLRYTTPILENSFGSEMVRVKVPRCMAWLDSGKPIDSLDTTDNEGDNLGPQNTPQTPPSFEEYTPPVTYPDEVGETLGTPLEDEPLDETKLEDVGLTCDHDIPLSSREVPSFYEPEPQPLPTCPSLDISLGDKISPEPPIKPHSLDIFKMKAIDHLTIHTSPSPHVAYSLPMGMYCNYHPCIEDPRIQYGFKLGLLGIGRSLCVDVLN
ncbi:hypothetical protein Tco_0839587 [Tanacetum coccineum]|uniref:Uncharacterized protein n=1 Tax=Tanacetum coccineum TaxID=301880 RepID=A0ABQ5AR20_9ASTR